MVVVMKVKLIMLSYLVVFLNPSLANTIHIIKAKNFNSGYSPFFQGFEDVGGTGGYVYTQCHGLEACDVNINNSEMPNPIKGFYKTLEVKYECRDDSSNVKTRHHLTANEGSVIKISCISEYTTSESEKRPYFININDNSTRMVLGGLTLITAVTSSLWAIFPENN